MVSSELIVIAKVFVAVALEESVTWKVTEELPKADDGVPEIIPLELRERPAGKVPEAIVQEKGDVPAVADRVCE
jgi:hypothetical protein